MKEENVRHGMDEREKTKNGKDDGYRSDIIFVVEYQY